MIDYMSLERGIDRMMCCIFCTDDLCCFVDLSFLE